MGQLTLEQAYAELTAPGSVWDSFWQTPNGELRLEPLILSSIEHVHLFPGSWNPLHAGHREVFDQIRPPRNTPAEDWHNDYSWTDRHDRVGIKLFELSLTRDGKEFLSVVELARRLAQFLDYAPVLVTQAPRMLQKAGVICGGTPSRELCIHLGYDTAARVLAQETKLGIEGMHCWFKIYPRGEQSAQDLPERPTNFQGAKIPGAQHVHLSSTQLRAATTARAVASIPHRESATGNTDA